MKRTLVKYLPRKGSRSLSPVRFVVTFDEYGEVDTIEQDGKLISASNKYAKAILNNAEDVRAGVVAPVGFTWGLS